MHIAPERFRAPDGEVLVLEKCRHLGNEVLVLVVLDILDGDKDGRRKQGWNRSALGPILLLSHYKPEDNLSAFV